MCLSQHRFGMGRRKKASRSNGKVQEGETEDEEEEESDGLRRQKGKRDKVYPVVLLSSPCNLYSMCSRSRRTSVYPWERELRYGGL